MLVQEIVLGDGASGADLVSDGLEFAPASHDYFVIEQMGSVDFPVLECHHES